MSTTRTVSIRDFRENLTKHLREGQEKNVHFIIMRHAEPVAHVTPVKNKKSKRAASLEKLIEEVALARKEIREGKFYTPQQILNMIEARS